MMNDTVEDSVRLASGGYLAALGVYHQLHCLVRQFAPFILISYKTELTTAEQRQLRLYLFAEVFYPNMTRANLDYFHGHMGTSAPLLLDLLDQSSN